MRTVLRYLAGVALVSVLIIGGVALRIVGVAAVDQRESADAIIVLGAAQYDGDPSPVFRARLDHAAALYRAGVAQQVVTVGGGQPGDRTTEGAAGAAYLTSAGIPTAALTIVGTGADTLESLRAATPELAGHGWRSVVLVTDPWHAARAALMATDLGLMVQVSPVTEGPAVAAGVAARYVTRESLGVLFYRLTGGSSGAGTPVL